jgi:hypothetical protein
MDPVQPGPIPRNTSSLRGLTGAPQYTLQIKDWKTDVAVTADAFTFTPPPAAKQVDIGEMSRSTVPLTLPP